MNMNYELIQPLKHGHLTHSVASFAALFSTKELADIKEEKNFQKRKSFISHIENNGKIPWIKLATEKLFVSIFFPESASGLG